MTMAPGTMVNAPAAASRPSSYPDVLAVRVMVAAIGFASTDVSVLARRSSTQENMKQKNAATPMPEAMLGRRNFTPNRGNEYPSMNASSSSSFGTPDMKPSRIQTASGTLNRQCASATAMWVS